MVCLCPCEWLVLLINLNVAFVSFIRADTLHWRPIVRISWIMSRSCCASINCLAIHATALGLFLESHLYVLSEGLHFTPVTICIVIRTHAVEWLFGKFVPLIEFMEESLLIFYSLTFKKFQLLQHQFILMTQLHLPIQVL